MKIQACNGKLLNQDTYQNLNKSLTLCNPEFDPVFLPQIITTIIIIIALPFVRCLTCILSIVQLISHLIFTSTLWVGTIIIPIL